MGRYRLGASRSLIASRNSDSTRSLHKGRPPMHCNTCRALNPDDAQYCSSCGRELAAAPSGKPVGDLLAAAATEVGLGTGTLLLGRYRIRRQIGIGGRLLPHRSSGGPSGSDSGLRHWPSRLRLHTSSGHGAAGTSPHGICQLSNIRKAKIPTHGPATAGPAQSTAGR